MCFNLVKQLETNVYMHVKSVLVILVILLQMMYIGLLACDGKGYQANDFKCFSSQQLIITVAPLTMMMFIEKKLSSRANYDEDDDKTGF